MLRPSSVARLDAGTAPAAAPTWTAWTIGVVAAAALAQFLLDIPIQVSDSFGNMIRLSTPWPDFLLNEFTQRSYLRPLMWAEMKLVHDLSGGDYSVWFRGTHALQVAGLIGFYLHLIRPRTWTDAALVPLGLAVLIGHPSFAGTVTEAFPINTFMTILLCCFAAAALSLAAYRWWNDVLAIVLFAIAALTVESGLLVLVVFVAGALTGARGISRPAVGVLIGCLGAYFLVRFALLDVGAPSLTERASGYGVRVLEPAELQARFGAWPYGFYAYNVVTSWLSLVVGEPRAGVFRLVDGLSIGRPYPAVAVSAMAIAFGSALIGWQLWQRRHAWRARAFGHDDQLVAIYVAVLCANACISYPYTKDVIMSPAAAFYAVAVFVSARSLLEATPARFGAGRAAAGAVFCLLLSVGWSIRLISTHLQLRDAAVTVRNEWATVDSWIVLQRMDVGSPRAQHLLHTLRADALEIRPAASRLTPPARSLFN